MHIFCTECGKHIDVSLDELENQEGHLVCPQCLAEIDVDVDLFKSSTTAEPMSDNTSNAMPPPPPVGSNKSATVTVPPPPPVTTSRPAMVPPPIPKPPAHVDDVMRYCKHCGAFLREGVNFCPKCGKFVRVTPPTYKPALSPAQKAAAELRAATPPVKRIPANKQSNYKPPKEQY